MGAELGVLKAIRVRDAALIAEIRRPGSVCERRAAAEAASATPTAAGPRKKKEFLFLVW